MFFIHYVVEVQVRFLKRLLFVLRLSWHTYTVCLGSLMSFNVCLR